MTSRTRSRNLVLLLAALAAVVVLVVALKVVLGRDDGSARRDGNNGTEVSAHHKVRVRGGPHATSREKGAQQGSIIVGGDDSDGVGVAAAETGVTHGDDEESSKALVNGVDATTSGTGQIAQKERPTGMTVLSGTVFDGETPAKDAIVVGRVGEEKRGQASVDAKGFYTIPALPPGDYVISAESSKGVLEKTITLTAEMAAATMNFDFADEDDIKKFPIQGVVIKKKDGRPVPDATIELQREGRTISATTTAANGTFEVLASRSGEFVITARAGFFLPGQASVVMTDGEPTPESVTIELNGTGALRVQVLNPSGEPVPGALVSLFGNATFNDPLEQYGSWQTMSDGMREIEITAPTSVGSFRIGAYKNGFIPGWSQDLSTSGAFESVLRVTLGAGCVVRGRIVDKETAPIEGAAVTVKEGFMRTGVVYQRVNEPFPLASSESGGAFQIGPLEPGAVTLGFGAEGYVSDVKTFLLGAPVLDVGDVVLEGNDDNEQQRVFGVVVDQVGTPMVSHNIYMKNAASGVQYFARTDSRGGFKIDKVEEGEYVIYTNGSALRDGIYITLDQVYPFAKPGEGGGLYLVYDMGQSLKFVVQNAAGEAVRNYRAGINVRYSGATGFGGTREEFGLAYEKTVTTSDGSTRMDHLISGLASVVIQAEGFGAKRVEDVSISLGGETDLGTITLDSGAQLHGVAIAAENKLPLQGVAVWAAAPPDAGTQHPLNALPLKTTTNGRGEFVFKNIPSGSAYLTLTKPGRTRTQSLITVEEDEETDVGGIAMALGARLRGSVTDGNGAVLPDILIVAGEQAIYTDRDGKYFYDTLPAGEMRVIAEDRTGRYPKQESTVTLAAGDEVVVDFRLGARATPVTEGPK
ncbi:carboxypeptidase regulatory-like domain-containing protein [Candidatus Sumerlaeota bacterium]|nr:carboxypeptidase regulatory-like domain-containing protein [Candidatus Sumerlaeota bacterium]